MSPRLKFSVGSGRVKEHNVAFATMRLEVITTYDDKCGPGDVADIMLRRAMGVYVTTHWHPHEGVE